MASGLFGPPHLQSTTLTTTISAQPPPLTPPSDQPNTLSFPSTGNPCLDLFLVVPDTTPSDLIQLLQNSWQRSPLTTLKLICNLRGVRGTGKNDKEGFYVAALWLHKHHPKTLALNIDVMASFGSLKDPLEVLFRILEGVDARKRMKREWELRKPAFLAERFAKNVLSDDDLKKAKSLKAERKANKAKKAIDRYTHDHAYQFLYDNVCDVFASLLRRDMMLFKYDKFEELSLAAKWCPSLDSSYDELLLVCEGIARKLFPREDHAEYDGVEEAHYAYKVRTRLRKEVLVPLRNALELPEVFMCAKRWREILYERVASNGMNVGKKVFLKRDRDGFVEYIDDVKENDLTIAAGALLPHKIVESIYEFDQKLNEVAELQWVRMLGDLAEQGRLTNCCAISNNIAGSTCAGFVLLVSELTWEPWKGKVITWCEDPEFHNIEGDSLAEKVESIQNMSCDDKVDLQKVFDKILEFTVGENLSEDQMLRRLFVFVEEEFEKVSGNPWEIEYAEMKAKFIDQGFKNVPEVVFWNLKGSKAAPVRCDVPGMAVVSGLSKNLLTLFFDDGSVLTPETVMDAAISRPEYDQLVIHD